VTAFFTKHPGGDKNLFRVCGIDATEIFKKQHGDASKPNNILA
jgi:cytochrome b involved in lipid metabolism